MKQFKLLISVFLILSSSLASAKIAVVGWGSLIWSSETSSSRAPLELSSGWQAGGPMFPVEFAKISSRSRVTLVIDLASVSQETYFADSAFDNLQEAVINLRLREGARSIHFLTRSGHAHSDVPPVIAAKANRWLQAHPDYQAVIWTGLTSNWEEKTGEPWSTASVVRWIEFLRGDELSAAREYILKTPANIQTPARSAISKKFGHLCSWIF